MAKDGNVNNLFTLTMYDMYDYYSFAPQSQKGHYMVTWTHQLYIWKQLGYDWVCDFLHCLQTGNNGCRIERKSHSQLCTFARVNKLRIGLKEKQCSLVYSSTNLYMTRQISFRLKVYLNRLCHQIADKIHKTQIFITVSQESPSCQRNSRFLWREKKRKEREKERDGERKRETDREKACERVSLP